MSGHHPGGLGGNDELQLPFNVAVDRLIGNRESTLIACVLEEFLNLSQPVG